MSASTPMTPQGHAKLNQEAEALENQRPPIKQAIATARAHGDLSENADYHAAREELALLDARLAEIHGKLATAMVVESSKNADGKAVLGSTVKLERLSDGKEITRTLVGEGEQDVATGRILTTSPIGEAVIGHESGEVVTASLPKGEVEFEILEIS